MLVNVHFRSGQYEKPMVSKFGFGMRSLECEAYIYLKWVPYYLNITYIFIFNVCWVLVSSTINCRRYRNSVGPFDKDIIIRNKVIIKNQTIRTLLVWVRLKSKLICKFFGLFLTITGYAKISARAIYSIVLCSCVIDKLNVFGLVINF